MFLIFGLMPVLLIAFQNCAPYDSSYMKFSETTELSSEAEALEKAAQAIYRANDCNNCHGNEASPTAGVYLFDRARLVELGYIVPGDPDSSAVYINTGGGHNGVPAFSSDDRDAIAEWIIALGEG